MTSPPPTKLPAHTLERWRQIVSKAARAGTDISQLVQHFAEQSFSNKVSLLEHQGIHRRALTNMRQVLVREVERGEQIYKVPSKNKVDEMARPYEASRFDFLPPAPVAANAPKPRKSNIKEAPLSFSGDDHSCTIVPLKPALTNRGQLRAYLDALGQQMAKIDQEIAGVDVILNQGVRNHQAVVNELAATSRELYRVAQEVLASMPAQEAAPKALGIDPTLTYVGAPAGGPGSALPKTLNGDATEPAGNKSPPTSKR